MKKLCRSLLVLLLTALPALAEFEGVMDMKITMTNGEGANMGGGDIKIAVGKPGVRSDMNMQAMQMTMKFAVLFKNDQPDVMYRINDEGKTYTQMDLPKPAETDGRTADADPYTVKKLGQEKILGYKTEHVLLIHGSTTNELWVAKDFMNYEMFKRLQARSGDRSGPDGTMKALKDAGAEGMPLKSISPGPMGGKVTMEVVKADKQSLPASTFEIPAGYTKSAGDMPGGGSVALPDEARKRMQDAMKNMTPEQRARIEQMMKQRAAPTQ